MGITRELDKKFPMYCYSIYTNGSMLVINNSTSKFIYLLWQPLDTKSNNNTSSKALS